MVKVVIGSVVLCHLLMPSTPQDTNQQSPGITKILGEVVDIQTGSRYIEKKEDKQALRVDTSIIVVKGKNKDGLYQIDSRACMLVRDETPEERENRLFPKTKIVEEVPASENEAEEEDKASTPAPKVEKSPADMEIQDRPAVEDVPVPAQLPKLTDQELKSVEVAKPKVEEKKSAPVTEPKKTEEAPAEKTNKSLLDYIK
jgi:hypothetical protein